MVVQISKIYREQYCPQFPKILIGGCKLQKINKLENIEKSTSINQVMIKHFPMVQETKCLKLSPLIFPIYSVNYKEGGAGISPLLCFCL